MNFSHLDKQGEIRQVPIQQKPVVERRAKAKGFIELSQEVLTQIKNHSIAKGNVLAVARIAGIQAAKKTADLIPLCHPLLIEHVEINFEIVEKGIYGEATVANFGKTGVEMEALVAVNIALLTIYDMCKAVDKNMQLSDIKLIEKTKGAHPAGEVPCQP